MPISFFCTLPHCTHNRHRYHCHPPSLFLTHGQLHQNVVYQPLIRPQVQAVLRDRSWSDLHPRCDRIRMTRVLKVVMGQRMTNPRYVQMTRPDRLFILFRQLQRRKLPLQPCLRRDVRQGSAWTRGTLHGAPGSAPPSKKIWHRWVEMMMMQILMGKLRIQTMNMRTALVVRAHLRGSGSCIGPLLASPRIPACPVHDGSVCWFHLGPMPSSLCMSGFMSIIMHTSSFFAFLFSLVSVCISLTLV